MVQKPDGEQLPYRLTKHFNSHHGKDGERNMFKPAAVDLLAKLLDMDPKKRLSANDALDHDWFWQEPMPCDPSALARYPSSHEYVTKKRRQESKVQAGQPEAKRHQPEAAKQQGNNYANANNSSHQNRHPTNGGSNGHRPPGR